MLVQNLVDRGCRVVSATNSHGRYFRFSRPEPLLSFQVAPQLFSRGWVDPVPDPLLLRKSGSAGNRTRDLRICSQEHTYTKHKLAYWVFFIMFTQNVCLNWVNFFRDKNKCMKSATTLLHGYWHTTNISQWGYCMTFICLSSVRVTSGARAGGQFAPVKLRQWVKRFLCCFHQNHHHYRNVIIWLIGKLKVVVFFHLLSKHLNASVV
jgi:hypothetical protein